MEEGSNRRINQVNEFLGFRFLNHNSNGKPKLSERSEKTIVRQILSMEHSRLPRKILEAGNRRNWWKKGEINTGNALTNKKQGRIKNWIKQA